MYIISDKAKDILDQQFGLDATGTEEDWDIELSDPDRVDEFLSFMESEQLDDEVYLALMALIVASYEELLTSEPKNLKFWERIKSQLVKRRELYQGLIIHYQLPGETGDLSWFPITPLMREL